MPIVDRHQRPPVQESNTKPTAVTPAPLVISSPLDEPVSEIVVPVIRPDEKPAPVAESITIVETSSAPPTAAVVPEPGLLEALKKGSQEKTASVGEALLILGASKAHIELAITRQRISNEGLAAIVRDYGLISVEKVAHAIAMANGLPYLAPSMVDQVDVQTIHALDGVTAKAAAIAVPVAAEKEADGKYTLYVAVSDERQENDVRNVYYPLRARVVIASMETAQLVYRRFFANTAVDFWNEYNKSTEDGQTVEVVEGGQYYNRVLDRLLRHACFIGASDIHFSPSEKSGVILLRVDGVRQAFAVMPKEKFERLTSILRTQGRVNNSQGLADASIDQEHIPKDLAERYGFRLELGASIKGDTAVIRILDRHGSTVDFDSLGFDSESAAALKRYANTSYGLVLVTGPTGSGKTTTLYSLLKLIDPLSRSVQTIENPVEYRSGMWSQYEVKRGGGTAEGTEWAKLLKGLLRNDPDVILLGEVRDRDTAQTTIDASNTGHLVFTTLHTNSAVKTISRLREMGLDMDALSNVLLGIVAQRLVRKLCVCKEEDTDDATQEEFSEHPSLRGMNYTRFFKPKGCPRCGHTGYRGRRMIYEVLDVTEQKIHEAIAANKTSTELLAAFPVAKRMWMAGLRMVARGETSLDELKRVAVKEV